MGKFQLSIPWVSDSTLKLPGDAVGYLHEPLTGPLMR
jgi:hypothetical protein